MPLMGRSCLAQREPNPHRERDRRHPWGPSGLPGVAGPRGRPFPSVWPVPRCASAGAPTAPQGPDSGQREIAMHPGWRGAALTLCAQPAYRAGVSSSENGIQLHNTSDAGCGSAHKPALTPLSAPGQPRSCVPPGRTPAYNGAPSRAGWACRAPLVAAVAALSLIWSLLTTSMADAAPAIAAGAGVQPDH